MQKRLEDAITITLVVCAIAVTTLAVRNQLQKPRNLFEPKRIRAWESLATVGHRRGPSNATNVIVEFADFQCPVCERERFALDSLLKEAPTSVAVVYRQYPLRLTHLYSDAAANASECAGAQGRFFEFANALFDQQNYIGKKPWSDFARTSGVSDVSAFDTCLAKKSFASVVERDAAAGDSAGVFGTPTLIVNGLMISGGLSVREIKAYLH